MNMILKRSGIYILSIILVLYLYFDRHLLLTMPINVNLWVIVLYASVMIILSYIYIVSTKANTAFEKSILIAIIVSLLYSFSDYISLFYMLLLSGKYTLAETGENLNELSHSMDYFSAMIEVAERVFVSAVIFIFPFVFFIIFIVMIFIKRINFSVKWVPRFFHRAQDDGAGEDEIKN